MKLALLALLISSTAAADPTVDIGFRVGGYGFRRAGDTSANSWNECRMNGVGVFASRALTGPLFAEVGLDAYFSSGVIDGSPTSDTPIDRTSGLVSAAIGARTNLTSWLRGYVQLGAGVELTRVGVPFDGDQMAHDNKAMPEGFLGVGVDLQIAKGLYVGASMRMLAMGNFDYAQHMTDRVWGTEVPAQTFDASPDLAAQGQFYVRRDIW